MKLYGRNKSLLPGYELEILLALAYYPELVETKISFRFDNLKSSGKTRPSIGSLLKDDDKHFIISLNNNSKRTGVLLAQIPFNSQVGLFGHELGHIIQMESKGIAKMTIWVSTYLTNLGRRRIERQTDMITIEHGLGWQLFELIDFILKNPRTTLKYRRLKERYYMQPGEILDVCNKIY